MSEQEKEVRAVVDAFLALPRAERRNKMHTLPVEAQALARQEIEARRGIAGRSKDGSLILSKDENIRQIVHATTKINEMPRKIEVLKENIEARKAQLSEVYGEAALKDLEEALKAAASNE